MFSHKSCPHPLTDAGYRACRKAGGPEGYLLQQVRKAKESAPCLNCLDTAFSHIDNDVEPNDSRAWLLAREYLYDRGAVSACSKHAHLID